MHCMYIHGKYAYSTLALEKEREIYSERRDSLKKGERSSMLLCTCRCGILCTALLSL